MVVTFCAVSTALGPCLTLLIRFRAEPFVCEDRRLELTHGQRETVNDRIRANVLIDAEHIESSIWSVAQRSLRKVFPLTLATPRFLELEEIPKQVAKR